MVCVTESIPVGKVGGDLFVGSVKKACIQFLIDNFSFKDQSLIFQESPLDAGIMVSSLLLAIQLCPKLEFQSSDQYGEDLPESTWEYIFAIELLCSHLKWDWTHNNIIRYCETHLPASKC